MKRATHAVFYTCLLGALLHAAPVDPDEKVEGKGFAILADRRVFAVMAFTNAAGFDDEAQGQQMHPTRIKVRQMVAANLAGSTKPVKWHDYYESRRLQTFHYEDWALSLSPDYPFRKLAPDSALGYPATGSALADFPEILNDFWRSAKLDDVWSAVKSDYIAELKRYDFGKMEAQMTFLWNYLRMTRADRFRIVNIPNLLDRRFQGIGARYEDFYYSVESPGAASYALNVHEYLHSIVNPLVSRGYGQHRRKLDGYFQAGKDGPMAANYKNLETFTAECLVRALDHRIRVKFENNSVTTSRLEAQVADITRLGLSLAEPFYRLLDSYEESGLPFDAYLPSLFDRL